MMTVSLAGCISDEAITESDIGNTTSDELALPEWQIGDQWCTHSLLPSLEKIMPAW